MKKIIILICIVILSISIITSKEEKRTFGTMAFDAIIIEKYESALLVSSPEDENYLTTLCISEYTSIIFKGNEISCEELKNGASVHVVAGGYILESDPGIIPVVIMVELLEK